jgi:hypothetical protein
MNYSRNLKKKAIAQRVLLSWLIVAVVVGLIGGVSGYALGSHITAKAEEKAKEQTSEQVENQTLVYGSYDDRTFTEEMSLDWGVGDLDFNPLDCGMDEELQEFVYYLSAGYNIDFTLAMAVIQHESSFRSDVVSTTNDYGLMQINKMNHQYLTDTIGITDFLDPYQNVRGGMFILRKLFERYQDTDLVLMCYNMGEDGAKRLWNNGIFETDYTQDILKIQQQYNKQIGQ